MRLKKIAVILFALILGVMPYGAVKGESNKGAQDLAEYDHVIIIGIDGAGTFFQAAQTRAFDSYFQNGAITYGMTALPPTLSAQGWGSLFYGVEPRIHGILNEVAERETYQNEELPSLYSMILDSRPQAESASICAWSAINYGIIDRRDKLYRFPSDKSSDISDKEVLDACMRYLEAHDPTLLFVHFDSVDIAGHRYGFGSEEYLKAIQQADKRLGKLFEFIDGKFDMNRTLVIVTTDHGGTQDGRHGGSTAQEMNCMFAIKGHNVVSNGSIRDMELRDIAPIVLYSLGIEPPGTYTGRIPEGIFNGMGGGERPCGTVKVKSERYRFHKTVPTPDMQDDTSLSRKLAYRNTFDQVGADDDKADITVTEGYYGSALDFSSYGQSTGVVWNEAWENISVSFWIKARPTLGDPVIAGNKNWSSGKNRGFILALQQNGIVFNMADDDGHRFDIQFPLASDFYEGWTHYLFVINRVEHTVTGFCDFEKLFTEIIDDSQIDLKACLTETPVMIGQDATGNYAYSLPAVIDEFIIFNDAITETEVERLREYYEIAATVQPRM